MNVGICSSCQKTIDTWDWFQTDQYTVCKKCIEKGGYDKMILWFLANKGDEAANSWLINYFLKKQKIELVATGFQYGFNREKQNDPEKVLSEYIDKDFSVDYIFGIDSVDSFSIEYSIYKIL